MKLSLRKPIKITHGYSRDHRPDLKQFTMELVCSGDGDIPLWMKMGDGNQSDQTQFAKTIREFKENFQVSGIMVADAALYTQENLQYLGNIEWLTRVPLTISTAQKLVREINANTLTPSTQAGYSYKEVKETYGGVEQRWLIVESQKRRGSEADLESLERRIEKEFRVTETKLKELGSEIFACEPDAIKAAKKLFKKLRFHELTEIKTQQFLIKN